MDNPLLKILLAVLLARQDLGDTHIIEKSLEIDMVSWMDGLGKQESFTNNDRIGTEDLLTRLFANNPEWQQQYKEWLTKLNKVTITPDWSPTKEEFEEVFPPKTLGGKPYKQGSEKELKNTVVVVTDFFQKVLTGNEPSKPELSSWQQLLWWQRIKGLISKN